MRECASRVVLVDLQFAVLWFWFVVVENHSPRNECC